MNDYNLAIVSVIKMIVENNAGCVARKLKAEGYTSKFDKIPPSELEATLLQTHALDRKLFFDIMKSCDWNHGNTNWTNNPIYRDQILTAVTKYAGQKVDKSNWWAVTINYLENN